MAAGYDALVMVKGRRVHAMFDQLVAEVLKVKEIEQAKEAGAKEAEAKANEKAKETEKSTFFGRMLG